MRAKDNLIVDLSFEFSIKIIKYAEELESLRKFVIARQLLRSGTSIGALVKEAQDAESANDFIHKMKIAIKEASETEYWLLLCQKAESYPSCEGLIMDCSVLVKILSKIISSSKKRLSSNNG